MKTSRLVFSVIALAFLVNTSTAVERNVEAGQTINYFDANGEQEFTLEYLDGGPHISLDGDSAISPLMLDDVKGFEPLGAGDVFTANGQTAEILEVILDDSREIRVKLSEENRLKKIGEGEQRIIRQNGNNYILKLVGVGGDARVKMGAVEQGQWEDVMTENIGEGKYLSYDQEFGLQSAVYRNYENSDQGYLIFDAGDGAGESIERLTEYGESTDPGQNSWGDNVNVEEGDVVSVYNRGEFRIESIYQDNTYIQLNLIDGRETVEINEDESYESINTGKTEYVIHACDIIDSSTAEISVSADDTSSTADSCGEPVEDDPDEEPDENPEENPEDQPEEEPSEGEGVDETSIELTQGEPGMGETSDLRVQLPESKAENGYTVVIKNPDDDNQLKEEDLQVQEKTFEVGGENWIPGTYTVQLKKTGSFAQELLDYFGASSVFEEFQFEVSGSHWRGYCNDKGDYNLEEPDQMIECVSNHMKDDYFKDDGLKNSIDDVGPAQSLCSEILGYGYDKDIGKCVS